MNSRSYPVWSNTKMNTPKIESVKPLDDRRLLVRFANGVEKVYDCSQLLHLEMFQSLKDDAFFRSVKVDAGGYGVSWNDKVDLSEYELWINGEGISLAPLATVSPGLTLADDEGLAGQADGTLQPGIVEGILLVADLMPEISQFRFDDTWGLLFQKPDRWSDLQAMNKSRAALSGL